MIRLTAAGRHNLRVLPFVIFVRIPIALPLILMRAIVEFAEEHCHFVPGLRSGPWFETRNAGKPQDFYNAEGGD